jgi:hypothetical protein
MDTPWTRAAIAHVKMKVVLKTNVVNLFALLSTEMPAAKVRS